MNLALRISTGLLLATLGFHCSGESSTPDECEGLADGTTCGDTASSECDLSDTCMAGLCVENLEPDGTACGDATDDACQNPDSCAAGICESNDEPTAAPGMTTFTYLGSSETFDVPCGITSINIDAYGAEGATSNGAGGQGGRAHGDLTVAPADTLSIYVGGMDGYNGGGSGGAIDAGNGGGASDVRVGGIDPADRVVVAGGGGGGGSVGCVVTYAGGFGGAGGGLAGGKGVDSPNGGGGFGGTSGIGGAEGIGCPRYVGQPGLADGTGGAGQGCCCATTPGGGGGGGGYVNGGGGGGGSAGTVGCSGNDKGGGGGGAGGSNYTDGLTANTGTEDGVRAGDGEIVISW